MLKDNQIILVEIGNSRAHIYLPSSKTIEHLDIDQAIDKYATDVVKYISVNNRYIQKLNSLKNWQDISPSLHIDGQYSTMGIDRVALCLSRGDALYVDAGSAITVDRVVDGKYDGGFIMLGIKASLNAYSEISKSLDVEFKKDIDISHLAFDTQSSVSYGIISPIIDAINNASGPLPLFFTGGDGEWLSSFFKDSTYDESLLFVGMSSAIASTKG